MPRASTVSDKVWVQAIHAVSVQKMSLRRAAQLYGVHHMSLHRRVRGRYLGATAAQSSNADEFALSRPEYDEVLLVLREQFLHEHQVTANDVRYVVRMIASQSGRRDLPSDSPPNRWIAAFKRVHGFAQSASNAAAHGDSGSSPSTSSVAERRGNGAAQSSRPASANAARRSTASPSQMYASLSPPPQQQQTSRGCAAATTSHAHCSSNEAAYCDDYDDYDGDGQMLHESTSESDSENARDSAMNGAMDAGTRTARQTNAVPAETWEKAMDAVEIHGMSLRTAAKAYGTHFAALHRRLKKRVRQKEAAPPFENYIPFEDEAGIVRVIHARADLGILMSYEELADLLVRAKLKYVVAVSADLSRSLIRRFQSRVEHTICHLICDWPLPRIDSLGRFELPSPRLHAQPHNQYPVEEKAPSPLTPRALLSPAWPQQNSHLGTSPFYGRTSPQAMMEPPALLGSHVSLSDPLVRPSPVSMYQRENETYAAALSPVSSPHGRVTNGDRRLSPPPPTTMVLRL